LQTAYYSMRGSVRYDTLATLVDVIDEDRKDINLNLIAKKKITGTVSLPEGTAPKDGVTVTVWATYGSDKDSQTVTIPEGLHRLNMYCMFPTARVIHYIMKQRMWHTLVKVITTKTERLRTVKRQRLWIPFRKMRQIKI